MNFAKTFVDELIGRHLTEGRLVGMRRKTWIIAFASLALFVAGGLVVITKAQEGDESCFSKSLHHTGEGMRYWYEEHGGFMDITHIPYGNLDCKSCHVKSCDPCHAKKKDEKCSYSMEKAEDMETCLSCHSRAKATFKIGEEKGSLDVHMAGDMGCTDCHKAEDVHGDGEFRHSMRDDGAVRASCENCHAPKEEDIRAHTVHKGKLDCASCHVLNSIACLNCHFDNFLKTGERKGNFLPPVQDWTLLVNYEGRVTTGTVQSLVYENKKFITYAPYFTHAVQAKGRDCADCHANPAVKRIQGGESVPMAVFKDNEMISWKGVVPLVPDQLEWHFLNKVGDGWVQIQGTEAPKTQFAGYGEPLTKEQIKKLNMPFSK